MEAGKKIADIEIAKVTRQMLKEYAEASGDHNPIHQDDEVAKKAGLDGVIAHGMLTAGFIAERANRFLFEELNAQGQSWVLDRIQFKFKAMTFPEDQVSVGGSVRNVTDDQITIDLHAKTQRDVTTTLANADFKRA